MAGRHQQLFQWEAEERVEEKGMIGGYIPVYEKKQRDRSWEQGHNQNRVTYRGVSPEIADRIRTVALSLQVNTGDVARAFLEFSQDCYSRGEIILTPRPKAQRMTLFSADKKAIGWKDQKSWSTGKIQSNTGKPGKKGSAETWRTQVAYRGIPSQLQVEIKNQAEALTIPQGELVTVYFQFALHAYELGRLTLSPTAAQAASLDTNWGMA
jgi:hypothetical protein